MKALNILKNLKLRDRIISAAVAAALLVTLVYPTIASAATDYSYIKVNLVSMGNPTSVTFVVKGAYRIAESPGVDLYPGVTYTIKPSGSTAMSLSYNNGAATVTVALGQNATFVQYDNGSSKNYLYVNNPKYGWVYYKGNMKFTHPTNATYLSMVNTLCLETYLYGVVAYEMSNSWPLEALKVQAVCARTYSMRYLKANYSSASHIGDTSSHQVYRGYPLNSDGTPQQRVIDAVNATRGKIVTIGSPSLLNLADGVFSASNGGQVKTANMQWGSTNTYHVFKDDPWDLKNTSSPTFTYIFPTKCDTATLNLLNTTDRSKVTALGNIVKPKAVAALAAKGISCSAADITIQGYKAATPTTLRTGMPSGSKLFTRVNVTVTVLVNNATVVQKGRVTTAGGNLNIRSSPSTSGSIVASAPNGAILDVLDTKAATGWYKVKYNGVTGYASSQYITLITPTPAPTASPTPKPSPTASPTATASPTPTATASPSPTATASPTPTASPTETASPTPTASVEPEGTAAGGGASPASALYDVTVTLNYISKASDGDWDVYGELKTAFSSFSTLINTKNMWNLYTGKSADSKFLYVVARGYGHGVGMSQRGAQQMANEGKSYLDILEFYYNFSTTNAQLGAVTITEKPLAKIPGKGASAVYGMVQASSVNVRTAPSTSATSFYQLPNGTKVEILGTTGDWYRVLYAPAGIVGYACGKQGSTIYIGILVPPTASPTASPSPTLAPTASPSASPDGSATAESTAAATSPGATASPTAAVTASPSPTASLKPTASPTVAPTVKPSPTPTPAPTLKPCVGKANVTSYLSLRKTASTSAAVLAKIPRNGTMTINMVHTDRNWLKVTYSGKVGYVMAKYVVIGGSDTYRAGTVTASSLNVRKAAGTSNAVLGVIKSGNTAIVAGSVKVGTTTWYRILYGSGSGYVDGRYLRISVTANKSTLSSSGTSQPATTVVTARADKVENYLSLRSTASTGASVLAKIPKGSAFTVLQVHTNPSWLKVNYLGKTGYVASSYTVIGGNGSYRAGTVTASTLNVRSTAGTSGNVAGTVKSGTTALVVGTAKSGQDTWYSIRHGSLSGYAHSQYVRASAQ